MVGILFSDSRGVGSPIDSPLPCRTLTPPPPMPLSQEVLIGSTVVQSEKFSET